MESASELYDELESYEIFDPEVIKEKGLDNIIRQYAKSWIPNNDQFNIKSRSQTLRARWNTQSAPPAAENSGDTNTANTSAPTAAASTDQPRALRHVRPDGKRTPTNTETAHNNAKAEQPRNLHDEKRKLEDGGTTADQPRVKRTLRNTESVHNNAKRAEMPNSSRQSLSTWPPPRLRKWSDEFLFQFRAISKNQCQENKGMLYECMHEGTCENRPFSCITTDLSLLETNSRGLGVKTNSTIAKDQPIMEVKGKVILKPKVCSC